MREEQISVGVFSLVRPDAKAPHPGIRRTDGLSPPSGLGPFFSRFTIAFKDTTEGCTSETIKGRTGVTPCDP